MRAAWDWPGIPAASPGNLYLKTPKLHFINEKPKLLEINKSDVSSTIQEMWIPFE